MLLILMRKIFFWLNNRLFDILIILDMILYTVPGIFIPHLTHEFLFFLSNIVFSF